MKWVVAQAALFAASITAALVAAGSPPVVYAAEPSPLAKVAGSLEFVPSDVSFYSVGLRQREQLDILLASNAWQKLKALPAVKSGWEQLQAQWTDGPLAAFAGLLEMPENEDLLSLLSEMGSQEIFIYGDKQVSVLLDLLNEANNAQRTATIANLFGLMNGNFDPESTKATKRAMMDTLADNLEALAAPSVVMGFQVKDTAVAQRQVKRLESLAKLWLNQTQIPELRGRLQHKKIGAGDFLTFNLDGDMFPADKMEEFKANLEEMAAEPGQYDALHEKIKSLTLSISIGTYKNYVLLAVSKSTEHLAALGAGDTLLRDGRLDAVGKFADQRLTSIAYVSQELMARIQGSPEDADFLKDLATDMLEESHADADLRESVLKDVADFASDLKKLIPQPGEVVSFAFLTPRGIESYTHDHSQNLNLDGSKRLDLLEHVGGAPLLAAVSRGKVSVDQYQTVVKWAKVGWGYFEKYAVPMMEDKNKAEFEKYKTAFMPLLSRWNATTAGKFIPSLADGQVGLVIDGQWSSKQWIKAAPETPKALALPEFALVLGVTDAKLLKDAVSEYQTIADDVVATIRKLEPSALPPSFKLPRPVKQTAGPGEAYVYALPAEAGLDPQIAPNAAIGEHTAVLSLSLAHSSRLLKATPFVGAGALTDTKQPLANAIAWNWSSSVDLATPWVLFGVKNYGAYAAQAAAGAAGLGDPDDDNDAPPGAGFNLDAVLPQVRDGLGLLKSLRTITSALRVDKATGTMIRHTEILFEDLP